MTIVVSRFLLESKTPQTVTGQAIDVKSPANESASVLGSVSLLYEQCRQGDAQAVADIWERFYPRLLGLARKTLRGRELRIAGPDDVVQSAFLSFWRGASAGQFESPVSRENLWSLMGVITVRKARKLIAREATAKRGGGRLVDAEGLPEAVEPDSNAIELLCSELFDLLDDELKGFAALRMMGYNNREVAVLLDCSERKVERKLQLIRTAWEDELGASP